MFRGRCWYWDIGIESYSWWRHQVGSLSALLALCEGKSPVTDEFPSQSPVTQSFDIFFDLRLYKRLSKPSRRWWFEAPSRSLWRHCNVLPYSYQGYFTWSSEHNDHHFANGIMVCDILNEIYWIVMWMWLKFVSKGQLSARKLINISNRQRLSLRIYKKVC